MLLDHHLSILSGDGRLVLAHASVLFSRPVAGLCLFFPANPSQIRRPARVGRSQRPQVWAKRPPSPSLRDCLQTVLILIGRYGTPDTWWISSPFHKFGHVYLDLEARWTIGNFGHSMLCPPALARNESIFMKWSTKIGELMKVEFTERAGLLVGGRQ